MDSVHGSQAPQGGETSQNSSEATKPVVSQKKTAPKAANDKNANFMASLSAEEYTYKRPKYGDIVSGVVVRAAPHEVLVDIGTKSEAIIASKEVEELAREGKRPQVGDEILAFVLKSEDQEGLTVLSVARAQEERDWRDAEVSQKADAIIEAQVAGYNKGGLIVRVGKIRGFVPASQLEIASRGRGERDLTEADLAAQTGKKLKLKIIEIDRARNRLILSERAAMREVRRDAKARLLEEIQDGDVRTGTVTSVADFGVFVDLGGLDGLIHVSELSWSKIGHPKEIVKPGDTVQVQVLGIDRNKNRIALSMKRLAPEPWTTIEDRYAVGQLVSGTITKLASFGAFARVDDGIEGLIHVSELSDKRINHPKEVVKEGEVYQLRVIKIDSAKRRLGLSLKRVNDQDYSEYDQQDAEEWDEQADGAPQELDAAETKTE
ncbi:MAG: S1 RNA-binding domain-containing protein [Chloroflexi bacterium]|nr:S1 RNA-binding domain-containing protein [Chloroflexota bacterium]